MRTIGRHYPRENPGNDVASSCDYCGVAYFRHELRRDAAGLLACKRDYGGDVVTLGLDNAARATERRHIQTQGDIGRFDSDPTETPPTVQYPDGVPPVSG